MYCSTLRGLLLSGLLVPCLLLAQQEAADILEAALAYRGLQSFWCVNDSGDLCLSQIEMGQHMTSRGPIHALGRSIPIVRGSDQDRPYALQLRKLTLNPGRSKAKVKFLYHHRIKARLTLRYVDAAWRVKGAFIRQKRSCDGGKGGRFVWDF
jgi:hypothetical protein